MPLHQQLGSNEPHSFALFLRVFELGQERFTFLLPLLRNLFTHAVFLPGQSRASHPHRLALLVPFKLGHDWPRFPRRDLAHAVGSGQVDIACHAQFISEKLGQNGVAVLNKPSLQ